MKAVYTGPPAQMSLYEAKIHKEELLSFRTTALEELKSKDTRVRIAAQVTLHKICIQLAKLEGKICKQESASNAQN